MSSLYCYLLYFNLAQVVLCNVIGDFWVCEWLGLRDGHFHLCKYISLSSQRHCNRLVLSFVVHCSITVDKVLEFCKDYVQYCSHIVHLSFLSQLCFFVLEKQTGGVSSHLFTSECLSSGLTDNKDLQCSSQMWLRQRSTLHWGGSSVTGSVCSSGRSNKSQPALHRLYPTVISGGTRVYYSQLWRSDASDRKENMINSRQLVAVLNCGNPETYLLTLFTSDLSFKHASHSFLYLAPNFLKRIIVTVKFIVLVTQSVRWAFPESLLHAPPPHRPTPSLPIRPPPLRIPGLPHPSHWIHPSSVF